jgi:hypothetical protein
MKLPCIIAVLLSLAAHQCCAIANTYDKSCFISFLIRVNQVDARFSNLIRPDLAVEECEAAVNLTLDALKSSSANPCVTDFLNKKDVSELLLRQYLKPQLKNNKSIVVFDEQFTEFRKKTVNVSAVVCSNKALFRPDVADLMRSAKQHKSSRAGELKCIELYIKKPNQPLSSDCQKVRDYVKNDFYKKIDYDVTTAFLPPHDQLISAECLREKAQQFKLFERVFFFVVLATTRDLNEKQIGSIAKNTDSTIGNSQKVIFECMK